MPPRKPVPGGKGRYSSSILRVTLRERYEQEVSAPDLLSLRDEISVVGAKIGETLEKIDAHNVDFDQLLEAHEQLTGYISQGDLPAIAISAEQLGDLILHGVAESMIWRDLYSAIEQRRKLVETEMKTLNSIGSMLSMQQVMLMIGKLMAALALHIDETTLATVHGEFARILDLVPTRINNGLADYSEENDE